MLTSEYSTARAVLYSLVNIHEDGPMGDLYCDLYHAGFYHLLHHHRPGWAGARRYRAYRAPERYADQKKTLRIQYNKK
jgi:hypothetical protein